MRQKIEEKKKNQKAGLPSEKRLLPVVVPTLSIVLYVKYSNCKYKTIRKGESQKTKNGAIKSGQQQSFELF